ncbi:MAG: hypothetical protein ACPHF4_12150 [Rubripirellula sp.]
MHATLSDSISAWQKPFLESIHSQASTQIGRKVVQRTSQPVRNETGNVFAGRLATQPAWKTRRKDGSVRLMYTASSYSDHGGDQILCSRVNLVKQDRKR